jgi:hypothetical protein
MPHRNRLQPDGTFLATPARGSFMGNRGRLHDATGSIGTRLWQTKLWITCTLRPKPGRPPQGIRPPNGYTRLFFHDEAVACAAGHRPCAECRRAVYDAFRTAWACAFGHIPKAADIDATLHPFRIDPRTRRQHRHEAAIDTLPDSAFILWRNKPHRVAGNHLYPYTPHGYASPIPRPTGRATVLTPEPLIRVLQNGWQPVLDPADDRPNW